MYIFWLTISQKYVRGVFRTLSLSLELFVKTVKGLSAVNYVRKNFMLDV